MTRLKLTIDDPQSTPRRQILVERFPFRLGRSLDNDLPLPFSSISSRHLVIDQQGDSISVTDLNSTNGTRLRGRPLPPQRPQIIALPARLEIGDLGIDLETAHASDVAFTMAQSSTRLRQMVDDAARQSSSDDTRPFFEVMSGPGSGRRFFLVPDGPETVIGTDAEADICLDLRNQPARLAAVTWEDSHCWLSADDRALQFEGAPLCERHRLRSGDRFIIGVIELLFFDPLEDALESMSSSRGDRLTPAVEEDTSTDGAAPDEPADVIGDESVGDVMETEQRSTPQNLSRDKGPPRLGAVEIALLAMSAVFFLSTLALLFVFLTA